jgi:hypothetical protein
MDIGSILDKLRGLVKRLIEILVGQEPAPEPELIPIPVRDRQPRRR